jgi:hypothetical protein
MLRADLSTCAAHDGVDARHESRPGNMKSNMLDPQNIPIDGKFATELVGPASERYR